MMHMQCMLCGRPTSWVQARGGCGAVPLRADLVVRVSSPSAGGEAASLATDVGRTPTATPQLHTPPPAHGLCRALPPPPAPILSTSFFFSSSVFAKQTSFDWRFSQPFNRTLLLVDARFSVVPVPPNGTERSAVGWSEMLGGYLLLSLVFPMAPPVWVKVNGMSQVQPPA